MTTNTLAPRPDLEAIRGCLAKPGPQWSDAVISDAVVSQILVYIDRCEAAILGDAPWGEIGDLREEIRRARKS